MSMSIVSPIRTENSFGVYTETIIHLRDGGSGKYLPCSFAAQ